MLCRPGGAPCSTDACRRGTRVLPKGRWSVGTKKCSSHAMRQWRRGWVRALRGKKAPVKAPCTLDEKAVVVNTLRATNSAIMHETSSIPTSRAASATAPEKLVSTGKTTTTSTYNTQAGLVFAIIDRKETNAGDWYRVQWCDERDGFRWDDTWEPGTSLRADGFNDACDAVDAWKTSTIPDFYEFCKRNGHTHLLGASPSGLCAFFALGIAVEMLDIGGWLDLSLVLDFANNCASKGRPISPMGVTYGELRCYVKFANMRSEKQISMKTLDKNLFGGASGKETLSRLKMLSLRDGAYICAGYNSLRVGHCIAVRVVNSRKYVFDETIHGVAIGECDLRWVYGISFVRRVELYSH